jgi:hypothetical protein
MMASDDELRWMSDAELEGRGILRVPFIFVPYGQEPPADWLAAHPGWVRIPATFVPRDGGGTPEVRFDMGEALEKVTTQAMAQPQALSALALDDPRDQDHAPVLPDLERTTKDGRLKAHSAQPEIHTLQPNATKVQRRWPAELHRELTQAVPYIDDEGRPVLNHDGNPMLRPEGFDPQFFIERGLADRSVYAMILSMNLGVVTAASVFVYSELKNFQRWEKWDAQRVAGHFDERYRDFSTVAIGLYAAASGIPLPVILRIQNTYAATSKFEK